MRTTVILKNEILEEAQEATGIKEKTALIHLGLKLLIQQAAIDRLVKLGGKFPKIKSISRRRP
jgi:hypothetical protein